MSHYFMIWRQLINRRTDKLRFVQLKIVNIHSSFIGIIFFFDGAFEYGDCASLVVHNQCEDNAESNFETTCALIVIQIVNTVY
jgi:hypothetical protein